ncbi:hypothetical protein B5X24_HaOG208585 [Helicoverpa armigera]|nr:hypothetical protein B5X24_HaOG208585 [Helicoverpa armigera]
MKNFATLLLIAAVASAQPTRPSISAILAQLHEALSELKPEPIAVGPAIVGEPVQVGPAIVDGPQYEPISVGLAIIDKPQFEPVAIGPALIDAPVPSPVVVAPGPVAEASAPLVQIILNINQAAAGATPIVPEPVIIEPAPVIPMPVHPIGVVAPEAVPVEPVQVVEAAPVPVEPVVIGTPVLPAPAVVLPEELN